MQGGERRAEKRITKNEKRTTKKRPMSPYQDIKDACCAANRQLPALGIVDLTFGNVSVVDRDSQALAIKPSGVPYDALTPDAMVVLSLQGEPDEAGQLDLEALRLEGDLRPSSDTPTHIRLLQAFPEAVAVVHTHSRNAVAFAQAGMDLPCLGTTHADYFNGSVPVTRLLTPEETERQYEWETGKVIVERFAELDPAAVSACLVRGHGPFVWGPSAAKAVEAAFALEIIAEMAMKTLALEKHCPSLPPYQLDKHFFRKHGKTAYYGQG